MVVMLLLGVTDLLSSAALFYILYTRNFPFNFLILPIAIIIFLKGMYQVLEEM